MDAEESAEETMMEEAEIMEAEEIIVEE